MDIYSTSYKKELEKFESQLRLLDNILSSFAYENKMVLTKNADMGAERTLTWGEENRKKIQIFLNNKKKGTYNLWLSAAYDVAEKRYWKNFYLKKDVEFEVIKKNIGKLLLESKQIVDSWK